MILVTSTDSFNHLVATQEVHEPDAWKTFDQVRAALKNYQAW